jgi:probable F420-dependent oxidoreductase
MRTSHEMTFSMAVAMSPLDQLVELARTAEECGFASIALPDSLFYMQTATEDYPYTPDGSRFWTGDTPWPDPLIAAAAMGTATSTIRFYTQVLKLASRNPLLLARQLLTVAALTQNRFGLGLGIGWSPEETEWCGAPYAGRGKRADEMIEVINLVLGGGMVEYHGRFFDFDKLQMSPAPTERIPIYVGGHTEVALKRAARVGDGWTSAMIKLDDLASIRSRLDELLEEAGRADVPFEIQAVCIDRFGLDGYRQQRDAGVTDAIVMPWVFYGTAVDGDLQAKKDGIRRFADDIIVKLDGAP